MKNHTDFTNNFILIEDFTTHSGAYYPRLQLSYQVFGPALHSAPVILVNHALTGNSTVTGPNGWWSDLIGESKTIDTNAFTVLAFDVPGNGCDGNLIENYRDFSARDVARIFLLGLQKLGIDSLFALIGGSVGGGIAWEMLALEPAITQNLVAIATDWKATDWLIANCFVQESILNNSSNPIQVARAHAMLCYRTPDSLGAKFGRSINGEQGIFNVESWLIHHGQKLQGRFQLASYKLMNHLLRTIDIGRDRGSFAQAIQKTEAHIHIIGVDSDLFFTPDQNRQTFEELKSLNRKVTYGLIESIHGHDAFLIEYKQLDKLLAPVFEPLTLNA